MGSRRDEMKVGGSREGDESKSPKHTSLEEARLGSRWHQKKWKRADQNWTDL
jgi:hypothetical protein